PLDPSEAQIECTFPSWTFLRDEVSHAKDSQTHAALQSPALNVGYLGDTQDDCTLPDPILTSPVSNPSGGFGFPKTAAVDEQTDTDPEPLDFSDWLNTNSEFDGQPDIVPQFYDFVAQDDYNGLDDFGFPAGNSVIEYNGHIDTGLQHFNALGNNDFNVLDDPVLPGTDTIADYTEQRDATFQSPLRNDNHGFTGFNNLTSPTNAALRTYPTPTTGTCSNITASIGQPVAIRPTNVVAATPSINSNGRFTCTHTGCTTTFTRIRDRDRHMGKHSSRQHDCPINGCNRKGDKAFYRLDKLYDHQRQKHKMTV
ncbi:MAG: hypothetical protein Q9187_007880, partial [Circinaria calcarea]